jgi:hypothetical protein
VVKHLTMTQAVALKDQAISASAYSGEVIEGMLRRSFLDVAEASEGAWAFVPAAGTASRGGFSPRPRRR